MTQIEAPSPTNAWMRAGVRRLSLAMVVLTVGQLFLWPKHDAHRSVFSFVMMSAWALVAFVLASLLIAGLDREPDDKSIGADP